jgi:hypothetical protein
MFKTIIGWNDRCCFEPVTPPVETDSVHPIQTCVKRAHGNSDYVGVNSHVVKATLDIGPFEPLTLKKNKSRQSIPSLSSSCKSPNSATLPKRFK